MRVPGSRNAGGLRNVQSALSHQIKALERELGVPLFARTSRKVEVTVAGLDLPEIFGELRKKHSQVRATLKVGSSRSFVQEIADGTLDVAVLGVAADADPVVGHRGVSVQELTREKLVAVVAENHRLAGCKILHLEELVNEDFVDFPSGGAGRQQSNLAFHRAGLRRNVAYESASMDLILGLVRQNLAVALLAPSVVTGAGLVAVPIADGPERVIYLAWSGFNPSPAALAFLAEAGD